MSGRFLRQRVTGALYVWTPTLAMRKDMVEYDPETAKKRIEAIKKQKADMEKPASQEQVEAHQEKIAEMTAGAKILTDIENENASEQEAMIEQLKAKDDKDPFKSNEDMEAEARQKKIDTDPEIINIRSMKRKNDVEIYLMQQFGEAVPDAANTLLSVMKEKAEKLRIERIFEQ